MKRILGFILLIALVTGGVSAVVESDKRTVIANIVPPLPMGIVENPGA